MRNSNSVRTAIIQTILGYTVAVSVLLLIAYIWVPDFFENLLILIVIGPICFTLLSLPIFYIINVWLALKIVDGENSKEEE